MKQAYERQQTGVIFSFDYMREMLPSVRTNSLELSLPPKHVQDVRVLIEHMASLEGTISVLPKGEGLAASIERVRWEVSRWTERLSADARIALARYLQHHPDRTKEALGRFDAILSTYHDRVEAIISRAEKYCCDIYDSVDAKEFLRALRARLGIEERKADISEMIRTENDVRGDEFSFFSETDEMRIESHRTPLERFMNDFSDADAEKLMIDAGTIDDAERRKRFVERVIGSAASAQGLSEQDRGRAVESVLSMLQEMRTGKNPYTLKVSSRTMLGLLPEIPRMDGDDPVAAFSRWRDARKKNEEDPEEPQASETVMPNQCGIRRGRKLNGNLVVYFNDGEVREIDTHDAHDRLDAEVSEMYEQNGKKPVALHFFDKHELEDTILHLPVNRGAVLHLRMKGTDLFCRLYRDETGTLIIEDEHGQFPAALRNVNVASERILANPFEFFSARNMRLDMTEQALG